MKSWDKDTKLAQFILWCAAGGAFVLVCVIGLLGPYITPSMGRGIGTFILIFAGSTVILTVSAYIWVCVAERLQDTHPRVYAWLERNVI